MEVVGHDDAGAGFDAGVVIRDGVPAIIHDAAGFSQVDLTV